MKKIGFSGTLDPITNGHMWVIGEARSIADDVLVFLSENSTKQPKFSAEQRKDIVLRSCAERGWDNVQVMIVKSEYTARVAKRHGVDYLIRGIRTTADFDYENLIQQTNVDVIGGAKTLFVMPPRDLGSVSSSFVKALEGPVAWNWTMKKFVPPPAYHAWITSWLRKEWETLWNYGSAGVDEIANANRWFARLTGPDAYGGAERHYHNLDHLVHGLAEIRTWSANVDPSRLEADSVRAAFWFHDVRYVHVDGPLAAGHLSNEEASAQLWLGSCLGADKAEGFVSGVAALIRATDHFQGPGITHPLKETMLSVDLAILGQDEEVYRHYAQGIRREYSHVPDDVYPVLRGQVLNYLKTKAEAGALFGDAFFAEQYNTLAISNMAWELEQL